VHLRTGVAGNERLSKQEAHSPVQALLRRATALSWHETSRVTATVVSARSRWGKPFVCVTREVLAAGSSSGFFVEGV
jgi:hypothetical protein